MTRKKTVLGPKPSAMGSIRANYRRHDRPIPAEMIYGVYHEVLIERLVPKVSGEPKSLEEAVDILLANGYPSYFSHMHANMKLFLARVPKTIGLSETPLEHSSSAEHWLWSHRKVDHSETERVFTLRERFVMLRALGVLTDQDDPETVEQMARVRELSYNYWLPIHYRRWLPEEFKKALRETAKRSGNMGPEPTVKPVNPFEKMDFQALVNKGRAGFEFPETVLSPSKPRIEGEKVELTHFEGTPKEYCQRFPRTWGKKPFYVAPKEGVVFTEIVPPEPTLSEADLSTVDAYRQYHEAQVEQEPLAEEEPPVQSPEVPVTSVQDFEAMMFPAEEEPAPVAQPSQPRWLGMDWRENKPYPPTAYKEAIRPYLDRHNERVNEERKARMFQLEHENDHVKVAMQRLRLKDCASRLVGSTTTRKPSKLTMMSPEIRLALYHELVRAEQIPSLSYRPKSLAEASALLDSVDFFKSTKELGADAKKCYARIPKFNHVYETVEDGMSGLQYFSPGSNYWTVVPYDIDHGTYERRMSVVDRFAILLKMGVLSFEAAPVDMQTAMVVIQKSYEHWIPPFLLRHMKSFYEIIAQFSTQYNEFHAAKRKRHLETLHGPMPETHEGMLERHRREFRGPREAVDIPGWAKPSNVGWPLPSNDAFTAQMFPPPTARPMWPHEQQHVWQNAFPKTDWVMQPCKVDPTVPLGGQPDKLSPPERYVLLLQKAPAALLSKVLKLDLSVGEDRITLAQHCRTYKVPFFREDTDYETELFLRAHLSPEVRYKFL